MRIFLLSTGILFCSLTLLAQNKDSLLLKAVEAKDYEKALALIDDGADKKPVAGALGNYYLSKKDFPGAVASFQLAVEYIKETTGETDEQYGQYLNTLGELHFMMRKKQEAFSYIEEAKASAAKHLGKEHPVYELSVSNLGALKLYTRQYKDALPLLIEGYQLSKKILGPEKPEYAIRLNNLAGCYMRLGQYDKAIPYLTEAKNITETKLGKDNLDYSVRLNMLAGVYRRLGQNEKAITLQLESKKIIEKLDKPDELVKNLGNLAVLYQITEDYEKALPIQEKAVEMAKNTLGEADKISILQLHYLGTLHRKMGDVEKALDYQMQALNLNNEHHGQDNPDYGRISLELAKIKRLENQPQEALDHVQKALENLQKTLGKDHPEYPDALLELAIIQEQLDQIEAAAASYEEIHRLALNRVTNSFDQFSEEEQAAMSIKIDGYFEHIRSFSFQHPEATNLIKVGYDAMLTFKGLILNNRKQLLEGLRNTSDKTLHEEYQKWMSLKELLARQYSLPAQDRLPDFDSLENVANQLESSLARQSTPFRKARKVANWKELQQQLEPAQAAIEFIKFTLQEAGTPTDTVFYGAYLIKKDLDEPIMISLFKEDDLRKLFGDSQKKNQDYADGLYSVGGRGITEEDDSKTLKELVWDPIAPHLEDVQTIYYSPDGLLHRINFSAIFTSEEEILANRYNMHLLGSTRQLVFTTAPSNIANQNALLFGGIEYNWDSTLVEKPTAQNEDNTRSAIFDDLGTGMGSWAKLRFTEREASAIKDLLSESGFEVAYYNKLSAREDIFKQLGNKEASPKIIHLATHGYFFPYPKEEQQMDLQQSGFKASLHPMVRSGLILAGANRVWRGDAPLPDIEDGVLTAYEIAQLDLSGTDLVVMSACETGLGDIEGSEGVYGLQRAFQIAGARYVIMSLWQVPDFATKDLMETFYQYWIDEKLSIQEAFQKAQIEMKDRYYNPSMWAGFVLVE